jgi:DNA-binding NarL/FixJ family response regulator
VDAERADRLRPLIVVEGSLVAYAEAVHTARAQGWRVVDGFDVAGGIAPGEHTVCVGEVRTRTDAEHAVLAAARGAGVVVWAVADRDVLDLVYEDLRRLGPVERRTGSEERGPFLDPEQVALLAALLEGATLGEAAARLHISRRTADRRLAAARGSLGVRTTAEALLAAKRQGLL